MKQAIKKITIQALRFHVALSTLILKKFPRLSRLLKIEFLRQAEDFEFISESFDSSFVSGQTPGSTSINWLESIVGEEFLMDTHTSEVGKISIIVPSFNGEQHIQRLLTSFLSHNTYENYEFIFVTQGSDDGTLEALELYSNGINVRIVDNNFNDTFTNASNLGAENASGEFLIFCNNDVEFISDALKHVAENFAIESVGIWGVRQVSQNRISGIEKSWHNGVGFFRDPTSSSIQPRNITDFSHSAPPGKVFRTWAVNGGFLGIRKKDFEFLGGFGREFEYGYEDVDLCIRCWRDLKKEVVVDARLTLLHNESTTRVTLDSGVSTRRHIKNTLALQSSIGSFIESSALQNRLAVHPKLEPFLRIAFLVSSKPEDELGHGDPLVAASLGKWLTLLGKWHYSLITPEKWYGPLHEFDVVLVMRPDLDLGRLLVHPKAKLGIWMRNRLDEWVVKDDLHLASMRFSSSNLAKEVFERETSLPCSVFRIAADTDLFNNLLVEGQRPVDVLLSENYWGHKRDIHDWRPDTKKFSLEVLGRGWGDAGAPREFVKYWKGFVGYQNLGFTYSKAKIVVDDATSATKPWAMTNMRVFEATASGCLVLSNCRGGVQEIFGNSFPTWDDPEELSALIDRYLNDESLRTSEVLRAKEQILLNHTYELRAQELISVYNSVVRS